tara:strand:+ start:8837 stop:9244 length:408 start_codon:yes stop_codon:yes gene_type:complete
MKFQHSIQLRVRYGETDQMGYCYYGNYAQYFEVGRVETLRELGTSYKELEANGYMLPVSELSVKYKLPAFYDDELTITTTINKISGARIFFDYTVKNNTNQIIAEATTTLVFVAKKTMKPTHPPESFLTLCKQFS